MVDQSGMRPAGEPVVWWKRREVSGRFQGSGRPLVKSSGGQWFVQVGNGVSVSKGCMGAGEGCWVGCTVPAGQSESCKLPRGLGFL